MVKEEYIKSKQSRYRTKVDYSEKDRLRQEVEELRQKLTELGHQTKHINTTDVIQKELEQLKLGYEEEKKRMIAEFKEAWEQQQEKDLEKEVQFKERIEKLTQDFKAKDEKMSLLERRVEQLKKALKEAHEEVDRQEKEKTEALTR